MDSKDRAQAGVVLVIDDDETITGLIETILSKEGYQVYTAKDGAEGIKVASEVLPDLVLMDITMPVLDGYETTKEMKKNPRLANTPVIFLTGKTPNEDGGQAFATGGTSFIRKPFTNQQLKDLIKLVMESVKA